MGSCPSWELSWWGVDPSVDSCPIGELILALAGIVVLVGELSWWGVILVGSCRGGELS